MNDTIDPNLLFRYLSSECTLAERAAVDAWIAADPRHREEVRLHKAMMGQVREAYRGEGNPQPVVHAFKNRIAQEKTSPTVHPVSPLSAPRRGTWSRAMGWGMAAAVLIATGLTLWQGRLSPREYVTRAGEREALWLSDGTRIILAPASRLRVPSGYDIRSRDVVLDGEGYFTVRHDAQHPFAVHARNLVIRDVGTTFDARTYTEDASARVAVAEGSVAIGPTTLRAGDVLVKAVNGQMTVEHGATVTSFTAWTQGTLVFRGTPLREAIRDISRTYDVSITVADSTLLSRRITVTLTNESIDDALTLVSGVLGARFERTERKVVIRPKAPVTSVPDQQHPAPLTTARAQ